MATNQILLMIYVVQEISASIETIDEFKNMVAFQRRLLL